MKTLKFSRRFERGKGGGLGNPKTLNSGSMIISHLIEEENKKEVKEVNVAERETAGDLR